MGNSDLEHFAPYSDPMEKALKVRGQHPKQIEKRI